MNKTEKTKKILALLSLAVVIILALLATLFVWKWLSSFSEEGFRDYIRSFGPWGWLVLFGVQFLQVFIALIPGEVVETAAGYAFGPLWGTVICYAGVAAASALIFFLTRRFGIRLVEVFFSREKINELKFINTSKKRNFLIFILFFIPGTPKDLITYFAGVTKIKFGVFFAISMLCRIPSIITSTLAGEALGEQNYLRSVLIFVITGAVAILGIIIYRRLSSKTHTKAEK